MTDTNSTGHQGSRAFFFFNFISGIQFSCVSYTDSGEESFCIQLAVVCDTDFAAQELRVSVG